jgi:hypothetical protein
MFKPVPRKPPQNGSAFSAAPWRMVFLVVFPTRQTWGRVSDQDILMPFGVARDPKEPQCTSVLWWNGRGKNIRCHGPMDPWTTSKVDPTVALGCPLGTSAALQESSICSNFFLVKSGRFLVWSALSFKQMCFFLSLFLLFPFECHLVSGFW